MTDCVYHAYVEHLWWLGYRATTLDWLIYRVLKRYTHGSRPQYTFGGVVPWMMRSLTWMRGLHMRSEYRIWTPAHHLAFARTEYPDRYDRLERIITATDLNGDYGENVEQITMSPAIYLLLYGQHAVFSTQVPTAGVPVAAIQLY